MAAAVALAFHTEERDVSPTAIPPGLNLNIAEGRHVEARVVVTLEFSKPDPSGSVEP